MSIHRPARFFFSLSAFPLCHGIGDLVHHLKQDILGRREKIRPKQTLADTLDRQGLRGRPFYTRASNCPESFPTMALARA